VGTRRQVKPALDGVSCFPTAPVEIEPAQVLRRRRPPECFARAGDFIAGPGFARTGQTCFTAKPLYFLAKSAIFSLRLVAEEF